MWKLGYEYGEVNGSGGVDATKNTGNVARQTLSFNGLAQPFVQSYKYDSLYRLTEAKETSNGNQTWKQVFDYDRYGNRLTHNQFSGTDPVAQTAITHPSINPANNRINSPGYVFDKNGNLTTDGETRHFVFNADNKQREVRDANNNLVGEYFYDGEGKRIKKNSYVGGVLDETTVFVYSGGKLAAEYSTEAPPPQPTTNWTVTDMLGSPRVILNSLGEVASRRDFLPFGEEILPNQTVNFRTAGQKYVGDGVRQKFTGYQKDGETGLDFAEARMYENRHARFTAVDPLLASGKSANPQTFNRYAYVVNNPLVYTDPTGLQVASWAGPVYTNGRDFSKEPLIGENSWPVQGSHSRYLDATDGYSYAVSESGSTMLGPTDVLQARAARLTQASSPSVFQGFDFAIDEMKYGAAITIPNIGIGLWNIAADMAFRSQYNFAPLINPLAVEPYPITSDYAARMTVGLNVGLAFAPSAAAVPFSSGGMLSVVPATTGRTVFSGHGAYELIGSGLNHPIGSGITTVPEGTSVTVYSRLGTTISDELGNAIELNNVPIGAYTKTYPAGSRMPNFTLAPPEGLTIMGNPVTVARPTRLSELLKPNMGSCHFAACSNIIR